MSAFALYAPNIINEPTSSLDQSPSSSDGSQDINNSKPPAKRPQKQRQTTRYPSMSECEQSIVAASALVGENLLDSPTTRRMTKIFHDDDDDDNNSLLDDDNDDAGVARHAYSDSRIRTLIDTANVGVIASGWAWVKRQRARRQREYLKLQAEVQLQRIAEAQEAEARQQQQQQQPRTLEQNPIYQQLTRCTDIEVSHVEDHGEEKSDDHNMVDQNSNIGVKVTSACISKSGLGISVSVEVPPDWQEEADGHHDDNGEWIPDVRVVEDDENLFSYPFILSHEQMQDIATSVLPLGISHCLWKRLYSLARDGDSFEACLRLVGNEPRSLLVLRTARGAVFGGFADSPWEMTNQQVSGFHGSAQACLYTFYDPNNEDGGSLIVYKWTGANRYFQLVSLERKMLAFGGGGDDGSFGLCIEQDFQLGSTGCCDTFGNQPLCDQENFSIVDMEIWSFVTGRF
jgi:hypothetical protein